MIVLHILLLILKIIGIILLCILGLILILCFVPVGVTAEYSKDGPLVLAHAGPVRLRLIPKKKKTEGGEKPPKKKKEKKKKNASGETDEDREEKPKRKIGGMIPMFRELLGLVLPLLTQFKNKLRIRELILQLTVGGFGEDPAKPAILYGRAWAALGNLMPVLMQHFRIDKQNVGADVDFTAEENTIYAKAKLTITIGAILRIALYYGIRALMIYYKHTKQTKKGGGKHVTSSQ